MEKKDKKAKIIVIFFYKQEEQKLQVEAGSSKGSKHGPMCPAGCLQRAL